MKNLSIIACISQDRGIGKDGQLLWRIPEDMKFFRTTTTGSIIVMGRKTYDSIGRPLPQRENLVLSSHDVPGVKTFHDKSTLDQYLAALDTPVFIIGGATLYDMYLNKAEVLYLTEVESIQPADTYFPDFDQSQYSRNILQSGVHDGIKYNIIKYVRR